MEIGKDIAIGAGHRWNKFELACGRGSYPKFNKMYCRLLEHMLKKYDIKSVVDYGCGNLETYKDNLNWQELGIEYSGYDAHEGCVAELKKRYPQYTFGVVELQTLPPAADAIIVKDLLIHWFDHDITWFFEEAVKKYKYIISMHDTTEQGYPSKNVRVGSYRDPDENISSKLWDEHFYGNKSVPFELVPQDRIVHKENVRGDSMKTFMILRGNDESVSNPA